MNNAENTLTAGASSSVSMGAPTRITIDLLRDLPSIWSSLTPPLREQLLSVWPEAAAIVDSYEWMTRWTKTRDDRNPDRPYKPMPRHSYLKVMHEIWLREPALCVEKSRSMMCSWWGVAEVLHYVMTHQPSRAVLWAQDQDRSSFLREYAWTLYENQHPSLKRFYPVKRPKVQQSFNRLELADGGMLVALPGKDPDKIRGEHPSILFMDEACFIENGGEAFDVALASRVPKVLVVSSAAPSWMRRLTKNAIPEPLS
jgi:hypothetical protein